MSVVPSPGSEPFALARRGLPLAGGARPSSPASWFVSFAFTSSRVSLGPDAPAMPRVGPPIETEQYLDENRLAAGSPWQDVETAARAPAPGIRNAAAAGARATMRPQETQTSESPAGMGFKTEAGVAELFRKRDAPREDIRAQRSGTVAAAAPAEEARNDRPTAIASVRAPLGTGQPVAAAKAAGRARQITLPPVLDQVPAESSSAAHTHDGVAGTKGALRAGVRPSMGTPPAIGLDDAGSKSPPVRLPVPGAGALRTAMTPSAASHFVRPGTASGNGHPLEEPVAQAAAHMQDSAPLTLALPGEARTPVCLATPMGTPHAAPRGNPGAAVSPAEIAQLVERARAALAANTGGRVTHRIGTVQVVVQSIAPANRGAQEALRVPVPSNASTALEPVRRGFRNPWTSYTRRND